MVILLAHIAVLVLCFCGVMMIRTFEEEFYVLWFYFMLPQTNHIELLFCSLWLTNWMPMHATPTCSLVPVVIHLAGSQHIMLKILTWTHTIYALRLSVGVLCCVALVCRAEPVLGIHQHGMHLRAMACVGRERWACSGSAYSVNGSTKVSTGGVHRCVWLHRDRRK